MPSLSTNGKFTLANTVISIATAFFMALTYWMLGSIIELREFAAKGDRFTAQDRIELEARIKQEIKNELPPKWLTDLVNRIDQVQQQHENRLDAIEKMR